jgi:putative hydrolase of the HAD superfamily
VSLRAVGFDLDDTLYLERTYVRSGFVAVARTLEPVVGEPWDRLLGEMLTLLESNGRGQIFDLVLERRGRHNVELVKRLLEAYRYHVPDIRLDPAVPEVLACLRGMGLKLGVLTDGLHVMQRNKLKALGVLELVDVAICTDELGGTACWKPSPIGFQKLLQCLEVRADEVLFVGNDRTKDIEGASAVGMLAAWLAPLGTSVPPGVFHISQISDLIPLVLSCLEKRQVLRSEEHPSCASRL